MVRLPGRDATPREGVNLLRRFWREFVRKRNVYSAEIRPFARIPVVRLCEARTGRSADVSMYEKERSAAAALQAYLFMDYANIDARVRELVLLVKGWSKARGINDASTGSLSSTGYTLLALFY
eukprot:CAMPEP_0206273806 /NCGR_PEP_ID=MMETSP0047_2-20121206/34807_1 /ASSEMBLY_ACC=CAM_ASM_000192 /TAXON_ID=195065 /ORGANISM="Chroomonas mesostigmatica_cf, Strain CCMP1168" /LENGTH=122 /DNA_ID=CAMNT_0053702957 /DNA_START=99 /DNA_END=464 /DNA_ORIENTATION=-